MSNTFFTRRGYLVDLDGTLISGGKLLPDSAKLLAALRGRFVIVSNDAEHTPRQMARRLQSLGLPVTSDELVLAGTTAVERIAQHQAGARTLLLGSVALRSYALRRGLVLDDAAPEIVLVTRDRQFNYRKLALASRAIALGAKLVVAAPDHSHPGPDGCPVPETGALAAAILACVGHPVQQEVIGKPEPALFEMGCARLGLPPSNVAMIGDNIQTDGLGARQMGMAFFHVQGGRIPLVEALEANTPLRLQHENCA